MHLADLFVFYDDVAYDARGWRNRNRVKTPQGTRWLTIPVCTKGTRSQLAPACTIEINWDRQWNRKHFSTLRYSYRGAPYFADYEPLLQEFYARNDTYLVDFTIDFAVALSRELGIQNTQFIRASQLEVGGRKTERLLQILRRVGATEYLTGPAARDYLHEKRLADAGIGVAYMHYDYPEYEQRYPPFDPYVSVLDLLFMTGRSAPSYIWSAAKSVGAHEP
jgi:hypothetical protein